MMGHMTAEHDRIPVSCNTPMPAPDQSGSTSVRAERLRADGSPRCEYCDDSGDVHTIIGDWLGICHCEIGQELQRSLDLGRTST
jgi:hypothetical protein